MLAFAGKIVKFILGHTQTFKNNGVTFYIPGEVECAIISKLNCEFFAIAIKFSVAFFPEWESDPGIHMDEYNAKCWQPILRMKIISVWEEENGSLDLPGI